MAEFASLFTWLPPCAPLYPAPHRARHRDSCSDKENAIRCRLQETGLKFTKNKGDLLVHFTEEGRDGLQVKLNQVSSSIVFYSLRSLSYVSNLFLVTFSHHSGMPTEALSNISAYYLVHINERENFPEVSLSLSHSLLIGHVFILEPVTWDYTGFFRPELYALFHEQQHLDSIGEFLAEVMNVYTERTSPTPPIYFCYIS